MSESNYNIINNANDIAFEVKTEEDDGYTD